MYCELIPATRHNFMWIYLFVQLIKLNDNERTIPDICMCIFCLWNFTNLRNLEIALFMKAHNQCMSKLINYACQSS